MLTSITIANKRVRGDAVPAYLGYMFANATVVNIRIHTTDASNNQKSPEVCHWRVRYTSLTNGFLVAAVDISQKTWHRAGKFIFRITILLADSARESSTNWGTYNISIYITRCVGVNLNTHITLKYYMVIKYISYIGVTITLYINYIEDADMAPGVFLPCLRVNRSRFLKIR